MYLFIGVMVKRAVENWEFWSIFSHILLVFLSWYEYLSQILLWYQVGQHCFVFGVWVAELSLTCWHQECVFLSMLIWFPEKFAMLALSFCQLLIIWDGTWSRCGFLACSLCKVNGKVSCSIQSDHSMFAESSLLRYLVTVPCYKLKCWTPHLNISF